MTMGTNDSGSLYSPRAELSNANMTAQSSFEEMLMASPEDVMRGVVRQHGFEEPSGPMKRKRSSSSSTTSLSSLEAGSVSSMVFSPILVKPTEDIVNVSSTSSSSGGQGASGAMITAGGARGFGASPVFNFNFNFQEEGRRFSQGPWGPGIWGGMPQGNPVAPVDVARAIPIPCPEGITPLMYGDDMGVVLNSDPMMPALELGDDELERDEEDSDGTGMFNLSQVD